MWGSAAATALLVYSAPMPEEYLGANGPLVCNGWSGRRARGETNVLTYCFAKGIAVCFGFGARRVCGQAGFEPPPHSECTASCEILFSICFMRLSLGAAPAGQGQQGRPRIPACLIGALCFGPRSGGAAFDLVSFFSLRALPGAAALRLLSSGEALPPWREQLAPVSGASALTLVIFG